ncbi:MAG TPA: hypothetical protein VK364_04690 [Hymenobacter sp.]|nr:hypothetical protein [Hymenobacter sp.]
MNVHLLTLLLSDENVLGLFFGGAYLLVGLVYVLIVGLLIWLYTGSRHSLGVRKALCVLALASGFLTFTLGIGMYPMPMVATLFLWVGFPLLVIILALIKPTEFFRWPKSPSLVVNVLQLLLRVVLFGAVIGLLVFCYLLDAATIPASPPN